jgi:opacity protein-like surface antigen
MRRTMGVAALALTLASSSARAQAAPEERGITLGGRFGYAMPSGEIAPGFALGDDLSGTLPLQLDLIYRFGRHFGLGGYFSYAFGLTKNCPSGVTCTAYSRRLGLQGTYSFDLAGSVLRPWIGLGIGYEWLREKLERNALSDSVTPAGFEYANLQIGLDIPVAPRLWVGPYGMVTVGRYTHLPPDPSGKSLGTSLHEWIVIGVKASCDF